MGHEYVELKNTAAAIDAYRHAVDINGKDYRAWYGLGQTYEILQMPYYALFYYRKARAPPAPPAHDAQRLARPRPAPSARQATALRPYDARMWCAVAGCYRQLGQKQEAIKCYQRAEKNDDREGIAFAELARLFREVAPAPRHLMRCTPPPRRVHRVPQEGDVSRAAHYYAETLKQRDMHHETAGAETQEALLFLANYCKETGALAQAQQYCQRLLDLGGAEKEEAKALLRDIRSQFSSQPHA